MDWISAVAIYFVTWWVVLFAVLPFGVRTQHEAGTIVQGTTPSAPVRPHLLYKFIATTLIAAVLFVIMWVIYAYRLLDLETFTFS